MMFRYAFVAALLIACNLQAEKRELSESYTNPRVILTQVQVSTTGQVRTSTAVNKTQELDLSASGIFEFRSRRLPPAGRDAEAVRSLREFTSARLQTTVSGHKTELKLQPNVGLIVSNGHREGIENYSTSTNLNRDTLDLIDLPGDPLAIIALLPLEAVEVGDSWTPNDWVAQMLTGIEAVESHDLTCQVSDGNSISLKVDFSGQVKGQQLGANTKIEVSGAYIFDLRTNHISRAQTEYKIQSDVGVVHPGLEVTVTSQLTRKPAEETGRLTDSAVASVPLEPRAEQLKLVFEAPPWGVRVLHGRDWHLFQSVLTGSGRVAILRHVQLGSLVCQCNIAPIAKAASGQHTSLDQFEQDIKTSLGERFQKFGNREKIPTDDGRLIFRVEAEGAAKIGNDKATTEIPMVWIYYLAADTQGHQASFLFSIEQALMEQLGTGDRDLVSTVQFFPPRQ